MTERAHLADIQEAHRLPALGVVRHSQHDKGDTVAVLLERRFQRRDVHVPLEWMTRDSLASFLNRQVERDSSDVLDVGARRVEMRVIRDYVARADDGVEENVFRGPALVRRYDVSESRDVAHRFLEDIK